MADVQNNLFTNLQGQPNLIASSSNPLFNESATNKLFWTVKIILMIINAFTGMIAIFIVLFGFAYPDEKVRTFSFKINKDKKFSILKNFTLTQPTALQF